jgi:hypothetical protein
MDVYVVDPASAARNHVYLLAAFGMTTVVCAAIYSRNGRKGAWLIIAAGFVMPALVTLLFDGSPRSGQWRWSEYLTDVVVPVGATVGPLSALLGVLVGMILRRLLRRHRAS